MTNEQDVHPEHQRKTISLTHKQAGTIGAIGAAFLLIQPLFDVFQTKDVSEAKMQVVQVQIENQRHDTAELKQEIKTVNDNVISARADIMASFKEFTKTQRERDLDAALRQKEVDERQDRRIEFVEAKQFFGGKKPTSRN